MLIISLNEVEGKHQEIYQMGWDMHEAQGNIHFSFQGQIW